MRKMLVFVSLAIVIEFFSLEFVAHAFKAKARERLPRPAPTEPSEVRK